MACKYGLCNSEGGTGIGIVVVLDLFRMACRFEFFAKEEEDSVGFTFDILEWRRTRRTRSGQFEVERRDIQYPRG
jgi:hypothetical protein